MKRPRVLVSLLAVVGISTAALFLTLMRQKPGPSKYLGKPIGYWFEQLPATPVPPPGVDLGNVQGFVKSMGQTYGGKDSSGGRSIEAITAFGSNAVPFLLRKLQGLDSAVEKAVTKAATNAGVAYLPYRQAELERLQAVTGLIHLKSLPPEAEHLLGGLRANTNRDIAWAASYVLTRRAALGAAPHLASEKSPQPRAPANEIPPIPLQTTGAAPAAGSSRSP